MSAPIDLIPLQPLFSADNTVKSLASWFRDELKGIYEEQEINAMLQLCAREVLAFSMADLVSKAGERVSESSLHKFSQLIVGLKEEKPLQYLLGYTWFYGLKLMVNENVLIPRPETEELVDRIVRENKPAEKFKILDIGTGSGCIALALKKDLPQAEVFALDVSSSALDVATENSRLNKLHVTFFLLDILNDKAGENIDSYDVMVSNPPYVVQSEIQSMSKNVVENEPHLALFVMDEDPLIFYRAISKIASIRLNPGGKLYVEINEKMGKQVEELLRERGFINVEVLKDLSGKDRMVKGRKNI